MTTTIPPENGRSDAQKKAEAWMVASLAASRTVELKRADLSFPEGGCIEVDGVNQDRSTYCEANARLGPLKAAQRRKLANDVLKLTTIRSLLDGNAELFMLVADTPAEEELLGK